MNRLADAVIGFVIDWVLTLVALGIVAGETATYLILVAVVPYRMFMAADARLSASPEGEALKVPAAVAGFAGWCVWKGRLDAVFLRRKEEGRPS